MALPEPNSVFRFGPFVLDVRNRSLVRDGRSLHLAPKSFDVLRVLSSRSGQLVARDDLIATVWPDVVVEEANLSKAVFNLRQVLGDMDDGRPYIETVPKAGYRFLARATSIAVDPPAQPLAIAVLPLADMSAAHDQAWFCEGISEELINALTRVPGVRVVARTSSFRYGTAAIDVRHIGKELKVTWVVEGSVRWDAGMARISLRLVRASDGLQEWSEEYERRLERVFDLQRDVAARLTEAVEARVNETGTLETPDSEAYALYLRGRYFWSKRPSDVLWQALDCFEKALARDPDFALAHAGIADVYCQLGSWEWGLLPPLEAMPKARAAARRALELAPNLAQAQMALGYVALHHDWDPECACRHFERALSSNPHIAEAHHWYSHALIAAGDVARSISASQRALELDPFNQVINQHLCFHHLMFREPASAVEVASRGIATDKSWHVAHFFRGWALERLGRTAEAIEALEQSNRLLPGYAYTIVMTGCAFARAGRHEAALDAVRTLRSLGKGRTLDYEIALILAALGDSDGAFDALGRAWRNRSSWLAYCARDSRLDSLRGDPRFAALADLPRSS